MAGREVRRLFEGQVPQGTTLVEWDLRDDPGRVVSSGVYLLHARTVDGASTARVVVVR